MFFLLVRIYMFLKSLFTLRDYTVTKAHLVYMSPPKKSSTWNRFWQLAERTWGEKEDWHYEDVTNIWKKIGTPPEDVKNALLTLEYEHDGKDYECVTRNMNIEWPPSEPKEAQFSLPITQVMMMNNSVPVRDVTDEFKKKMGPRKDFHGEDVPVEDLFDWDDYTDIMFTNALNVQRTVSRKISCLELL